MSRRATCLGDGGVIATHGLLSGKPCEITVDPLVFRGITLKGFWLGKVLATLPHAEVTALYDDLARRTIDGTLAVGVEAVHPITRITEALAHAKRERRSGRILIDPQA